jgi:hypothetical protein
MRRCNSREYSVSTRGPILKRLEDLLQERESMLTDLESKLRAEETYVRDAVSAGGEIAD